MKQTILGVRIRERRRGLGITQADLARNMGISPSYLNLIERNKRNIAGALLRRAADALEIPLAELDGVAERRLLVELEEIAGIPEISELGAEAQSVGELIGRFPGWARACAALFRSESEARETTRALADRLTHDPFLGDTVHEMLTQIAAVRAAAEILTQYDDIDSAEMERFHSMIEAQSVRLTEIGESLAIYFARGDVSERVLTPLDEVEALFEGRSNRFVEVEDAAEGLAPALASSPGRSLLEQAREVSKVELGELIEDVVAREPRIETVLAANHARDALIDYATAALLAPMSIFAPRAAELCYDLEALSQSFSLSVETVCHRLVALPGGEDVPRFGYVRANASGTIVQARALPGFGAPRYASACPLWVLFRAQQSPEAVLRQRAIFPSGARFVFVARARNTGLTGFGKPRHYVTDMIVMSERDAALTVYAPEADSRVEQVGSACRSCPRRDCSHRVADPLAG